MEQLPNLEYLCPSDEFEDLSDINEKYKKVIIDLIEFFLQL